MPDLPVSLDLFQTLIEYMTDVAKGNEDIEEPPRDTEPVIVFVENFYLQLFQNEVRKEITGINLDNKRIAAKARYTLKKAGARKEMILLVTWFERLCDIYPDLLAVRYGEEAQHYVEFLTEYLATLLERIDKWAATVSDYVELRTIAEEAVRAHDDMVASIG